MRVSELPRPSPERLLKQVQAEESKRWGAKLKIFLGYAPGVGKSYRMLDEARRRHERGEDVVVGAVQGQPSEEVQAILRKLESIPPIQTAASKPFVPVGSNFSQTPSKFIRCVLPETAELPTPKFSNPTISSRSAITRKMKSSRTILTISTWGSAGRKAPVGTVAVVGLGPGDTDWMTPQSRRELAAAKNLFGVPGATHGTAAPFRQP